MRARRVWGEDALGDREGRLARAPAPLAGNTWLVVLAALNTVASLFYYLRWIAPAVRTTDDRRPLGFDRLSAATAYTAAAVSVVLGPLTGLVLAAVGSRGLVS